MNALCRHFGACGGCTLQDLNEATYSDFKRDLIVGALARNGIVDVHLERIVAVPPRTRRRTTLKAEMQAAQVLIGFHGLRSHDIADMRECHVLTPALFAAVQELRPMMRSILGNSGGAELYLLEADNGIDMALNWKRALTPALVAAVAKAAPCINLIRVISGDGLVYESAAPEIRFGKAIVHPPPRAFLQPTLQGETDLQARVIQIIGRAKRIADLFCGCGTFTLPLAEQRQVHAVDADQSLLNALAAAARMTSGLKPIATERRDLFRNPLFPPELNRFDAVVLDPPRAGALAQARQLAKSAVKRVAYVSCDAASFARDARVLVDGGFRLAEILGVDQFLWSAHIELAATFTRD